jgi:YfiH family protein
MNEAPPPPPFLTAAALGVPHGFFTRAGGVSTGPFAALNGSSRGGDDPASVAENRARAARALGLAPGHLVGLDQVHSARVHTVTAPCGGLVGDGLVTRSAGLGLLIVTADCAPVLLADPEAGVIGAAHAGWRGAAGGVLEAVVAAMEALGARPARVHAAIGPAIGAAHYQVQEDVRAVIAGLEAKDARFFTPHAAGGFHFDLPAYCAARLARAGVAQVEILPCDTYADEARFFSHRRRVHRGGGPIGHQMSVIRR